mmetsp:Transcript_36120/g.72841  ORF Transcript_36120/g.72841 Transcript_36120/m.72841 type:complete len:302 (-) Transcript_36120:578-1483(-)
MIAPDSETRIHTMVIMMARVCDQAPKLERRLFQVQNHRPVHPRVSSTFKFTASMPGPRGPRHREGQQACRGVEEEGPVVVHGGRRRSAAAQYHGVFLFGNCRVGDVKERDLHSLYLSLVCRGGAQPQQVRAVHRMEVVGPPRDLELADHTRRRRVAQVEGEERVHLAERDEIAPVPLKAGGKDILPRGQPRHLARPFSRRVKHKHAARTSAAPGVNRRGRDAKVPSVLVHGKLVQHRALNRHRVPKSRVPLRKPKHLNPRPRRPPPWQRLGFQLVPRHQLQEGGRNRYDTCPPRPSPFCVR